MRNIHIRKASGIGNDIHKETEKQSQSAEQPRKPASRISHDGGESIKSLNLSRARLRHWNGNISMTTSYRLYTRSQCHAIIVSRN